jgi:hypothetical protein
LLFGVSARGGLLCGGLAFDEFASVADASVGVVRDLGDGGDVQCTVELAVSSGVEPMPVLERAGGGDGGGGVGAGVVAGVGEPADVTGVAEDDRGAERADAVVVGDGTAADLFGIAR